MLALWLTLLVIGLITFLYRFWFIFFLARIQFPVWLKQALRFVPVAALTALTVPELLLHSGALHAFWHNERLLAGLLAVLVAWWTQNIMFTIVAGMICLYLLQALGV